jgi:hypothetical protein
MKKTPVSFQVAFLAALLGVVLSAAGCSLPRFGRTQPTLNDVLESYREHLSVVVEDSGRAGQLAALGEELFIELQMDMEELRGMAKELRRRNTQYDTTREELASLLEAMNDHRRQMLEKVLAARAQAVSLTTPEEWTDLMKRRKTLSDLARESPGLF